MGGGFGAFGGFIETTDRGDYRPKRELVEELSELAETQEQKDFIKRLAKEMEYQPMFTTRDDQHMIVMVMPIIAVSYPAFLHDDTISRMGAFSSA